MKPCAARSIAAAALFVLAVSLPAEQQPARPVLRSGIDLVTVDVTVLSRSGEPLVELGPDDFTITVDGVPRRIVGLRLVRRGTEPGQPVAQGEAPAGATAAVRWPPRPSARRFLLVIDRDHIPAGEGQQMLEAGARFIEGLPASDSAAVWTIPPAKSGLQFSTDRDAVKRELRLAVGTHRPPLVGGVYGRGQFNIGREEALQIADDNRRDVLVSVQQRECPTFDPAHLSCPDDVETAAKIVASDWHQRAQVTLTALNSLVRALGTVVGTKDLVLITGGPLNTREELGLIEDVAAIAAASRVTVHAMQVIEAPDQARTDQMRATHGTIDQALSAA